VAARRRFLGLRATTRVAPTRGGACQRQEFEGATRPILIYQLGANVKLCFSLRAFRAALERLPDGAAGSVASRAALPGLRSPVLWKTESRREFRAVEFVKPQRKLVGGERKGLTGSQT
jgi:hypothetical protein